MTGLRWTEQELASHLAKRGAPVAVRPGDLRGHYDYRPLSGVSLQHKLGRGKRVEIDGYKFPSQAEARRYCELRLLQKIGEIRDLVVHPSWRITLLGVDVCRVEMDFIYFRKVVPERTVPRMCAGFERVVEDVKRERRDKYGKVKFTTDTRISKINRRLLKACYGIDVRIVKS